MAISNTAVNIGAPAATGAICIAPLGTAAPTTAAAVPGDGFVDVGHVSDKGLTLNRNFSTTDLKNWNLDVVRTLVTDHKCTIDFELLQTDPNTMKVLFGEDNVTAVGTDGFKVEMGSDLPDRAVFVFSMKDGDDRLRIVMKDAQITSMGSVPFAKNGAIVWPVTVTGYVVDGSSAIFYKD